MISKNLKKNVIRAITYDSKREKHTNGWKTDELITHPRDAKSV